MKAEHIKGMAKHIMSDGKHPMPAEEPDQDDLGELESAHIEPVANGYMVRSTHKAKMPYKEGDTDNTPAPVEAQEAKQVFTDHPSMMAHVHKITRPRK